MEKTIILHGLTLGQLTEIIENSVEAKVSAILAKAISSKDEIKYLSRYDVCKLLKISLPTLYMWTKLGMVISHKIGNRVLYKSNEIEMALNGSQKFKRYKH